MNEPAKPGAICPTCGCRHCPQSNGSETITRFGHSFTKRRRQCRACGQRFITEERVVALVKQRKLFPDDMQTD